MARTPRKKHIESYERKYEEYERLAKLVAATLETILRHKKLDYLDITSRAKSIESFSRKLKAKTYKNPISDVTDLAGIRVIAYIERDLERIEKIIRESFNVHDAHSVNKSKMLGADRFGYRSLHFVCDIGVDRKKIPEFIPYQGMRFEIQVRTALQHAWAEIEHDRSYKFSGELPSHLKRRFSLVAGLLELADREFCAVTEEIDKYASLTKKKIENSDFGIEINSTSVTEYLRNALSAARTKLKFEEQPVTEKMIEELRDFKISTIEELNELFSKEFLTNLTKAYEYTTTFGVLHDAMMYHDLERYFSDAWKGKWSGVEADGIKFLSEKYNEKKVIEVMKTNDVDLLDESSFTDEEFNIIDN